MNSREYWEKRAAERMFDDMKTAEAAAEEIRSIYNRASTYIQLQGQGIFETFRRKTGLSEEDARKLLLSVDDPTTLEKLIEYLEAADDPATSEEVIQWLRSGAARSRLARLAELQTSIDTLIPMLYRNELAAHEEAYRSIIKNSYMHKIFDIQQYTGYGRYVTPMDPNRIERLMRERWLGGNYSSRIWGNTTKLANALKEELLVSFLTGRPQLDAWLAIESRFGAGYNNARRLIRTESNYMANQAHAEAYKDSGIEKYIYVATLDLKTSEICRSLDGKTFFVKDAQPGKNYPPMHPWCRSTTIAWIPAALLAKMKRNARDPLTGKNYTVPANMTYNEWYKKYVKPI